MFRNMLQIKLVDSGKRDSFEYSLFELDLHSTTIHILRVNLPPYSKTHAISTDIFYEFTTFLEEIITTHRTVIISGDFYIYHNKVNDLDIK